MVVLASKLRVRGKPREPSQSRVGFPRAPSCHVAQRTVFDVGVPSDHSLARLLQRQHRPLLISRPRPHCPPLGGRPWGLGGARRRRHCRARCTPCAATVCLVRSGWLDGPRLGGSLVNGPPFNGHRLNGPSLEQGFDGARFGDRPEALSPRAAGHLRHDSRTDGTGARSTIPTARRHRCTDGVGGRTSVGSGGAGSGVGSGVGSGDTVDALALALALALSNLTLCFIICSQGRATGTEDWRVGRVDLNGTDAR